MSYEPGDIISDEAQSQAKEFGFEAYAKTIAGIIAKKKEQDSNGHWHLRALGLRQDLLDANRPGTAFESPTQ